MLGILILLLLLLEFLLVLSLLLLLLLLLELFLSPKTEVPLVMGEFVLECWKKEVSFGVDLMLRTEGVESLEG